MLTVCFLLITPHGTCMRPSILPHHAASLRTHVVHMLGFFPFRPRVLSRKCLLTLPCNLIGRQQSLHPQTAPTALAVRFWQTCAVTGLLSGSLNTSSVILSWADVHSIREINFPLTAPHAQKVPLNSTPEVVIMCSFQISFQRKLIC